RRPAPSHLAQFRDDIRASANARNLDWQNFAASDELIEKARRDVEESSRLFVPEVKGFDGLFGACVCLRHHAQGCGIALGRRESRYFVPAVPFTVTRASELLSDVPARGAAFWPAGVRPPSADISYRAGNFRDLFGTNPSRR